MSNKNEAIRERAYLYHLKGLTFTEIGKLLDLSPRTVERYSQSDGWKARANPKTLTEKANELRERGLSYAEAAKVMGVSKSTVYNRLKGLEAKSEAKS